MKKPLILMMLVSLMFIFSSGCGTGDPQPDSTTEEQTFTATILEMDDRSLLVEPVEGEAILRSADRISVGTGDLPPETIEGFSPGDEVVITFTGGVMESYPAQLGEVLSITPSSDAKETNKSSNKRGIIVARLH